MKYKGCYFVCSVLLLFLFSSYKTVAAPVTETKKGRMQQSIPGPADSLLPDLLAKYPALFAEVLSRKDEWGVQVIYTEIDRGRKKKQAPRFTDHFFNHEPSRYFYPASTVKLPVAILALQKLNELNLPGLDKYSTMITGSEGGSQTAVQKDPSAPGGLPSIAHYIKKILLVSDNDAYNRLYEFLGQEYINNSLHRMGYKDVQLIHRLEISLGEEENRFTNPVYFLNGSGDTLYRKPAERSRLPYAQRNTKIGKGYIRAGQLVEEPFDFSQKNRLPLADLHAIVRSILFPEAVPATQRFNLTKEDYDFLRKYMSMRPGESASPKYDTTAYWDNYVKMVYYGAEKTKPEPGIRIFNKTGTAYGFLIESCYFADFSRNIEFLLSAVIYCNSDGILNDNNYDYRTIGYPFFKNLGQVIYQYEGQRKRKHIPDLSPFRYNYKE